MTVETRVKAINCLHFINGQFVESQNKKTFENIIPATEEVMGMVAEGGKEEVDYAVAAARRALNGSWKKTTTVERSKILRRIGNFILERKEQLAKLESLDTGKPFWLANSVDIPRAAYNFHFFADYMMSVNTDANQQDDLAIHYSYRHQLALLALLNLGIYHYYY